MGVRVHGLAAVMLSATLLATAGCRGSESASAPTSETPVPPTPSAAPTTGATGNPSTDDRSTEDPASGTTTGTPPASPPAAATDTTYVAIEFPPPGLPLRPETEIVVGDTQLFGLIGVDGVLFAMAQPSVVVRIDPADESVTRLDLDLGESPEGVARHAYAADGLWVIGGPFRDTLVDVDPSDLTERRRIRLADDHGIRQQSPRDELWLSTLRGVRRVDAATGEVGDVVALEVDPRALDVGETGVFVALPAAAQVARIDPVTSELDTIDTEPGPTDVAVHDGVVWVAHPATATISRIDATTGDVLGVTDVDIGGDAASVTDILGLSAGDSGVWAILRFAGSPYHPVVVRLDARTGEIRGARTLQIEGTTWEATGRQVWFHRSDTGSLVAVDIDDFDTAPATDVSELADAVVTTPPPTTTTSTIPADVETAVTAAFDRFVDPTVASTTLGLGSLGAVRDGLLDLLGAQPDGALELTAIVVDGATATTVFDVVVQDTVVLAELEFAFDQGDDGSWTITPESVCEVGAGLGVPCP